nr:RcpC/CpaB family pilus assembly protein [Collinsella urealyticum]
MRLLISLATGAAAALFAFGYATSVKAEAARTQRETMERFGGELVQVLVATRDIEPGEVIDAANVVLEDWVASLVPADAQTSMAETQGKTATSRIPRRAVLCPQYFLARERGAEVPAGTVALAVASDAEHSVGGSLARGDAVDVYVSRDGIADLICSACVLDTSARAEGNTKISWVSLAVAPEHVREVLLAASQAPISLTLPAVATGKEG